MRRLENRQCSLARNRAASFVSVHDHQSERTLPPSRRYNLQHGSARNGQDVVGHTPSSRERLQLSPNSCALAFLQILACDPNDVRTPIRRRSDPVGPVKEHDIGKDDTTDAIVDSFTTPKISHPTNHIGVRHDAVCLAKCLPCDRKQGHNRPAGEKSKPAISLVPRTLNIHGVHSASLTRVGRGCQKLASVALIEDKRSIQSGSVTAKSALTQNSTSPMNEFKRRES
jgi:hypothetical protein